MNSIASFNFQKLLSDLNGDPVRFNKMAKRVHDHDSVWEVDWEGKARFSGSHPTTKPVELFVRPMKKHTKPGDIVFEPFSGSGSQLIAAERTGRLCRAIEISPPFIDVAIHRWQKATGSEATLDDDGRTFAEVAVERGTS